MNIYNDRDVARLINFDDRQFLINEWNRVYEPGKRVSDAKIWEIKYYFEITGGNYSDTARFSRVSYGTAKKWADRDFYQKLGRPKFLTEKSNEFLLDFISQLIVQQPCIYLGEISEIIEELLQVRISIPYVCKMVNSLGLVRKKAIQKAFYRKRAYVQIGRFNWRCRVGGYTPTNDGNAQRTGNPIDPHSFYWIDESHLSYKDLQRVFGRALKGVVPKSIWHRLKRTSFSVLCLINHRYFLRSFEYFFRRVVHFEIYPSSGTAINSARFQRFLQTIHDLGMIPNNCLLGLDNATIHGTQAIRRLLRNFNTWFLPPYSPDYTPIELLFQYMKIKMKEDFTSPRDVRDIVRDILNNVPQNIMEGFYRESTRWWYSNEE